MGLTITNIQAQVAADKRRVPSYTSGLIDQLDLSLSDTPAAKGDPIDIPVVTPGAVRSSQAPATTFQAAADTTVTGAKFYFDTEDEYTWQTDSNKEIQLANAGVLGSFVRQHFEHAIRAFCERIDAAAVAYLTKTAGRALGTPGTNPFASSADALATVDAEMNDMRASRASRVIIPAPAHLLKLRVCADVKSSAAFGSDAALKQGLIGTLHNMGVSNAPMNSTTHTKGTGTGYLVSGATAAGVSAVTLKTGTGTILAGDLLTFAGDSRIYVAAAAMSGNVVTLTRPLQQSFADGAAVTVGNSADESFFFNKGTTSLLIRPTRRDYPSHVESRVITLESEGGQKISASYVRVIGDGTIDNYLRVCYGVYSANGDQIGKLVG